jgi:3-dehydro-L-gulonate 2-dehydrogenase
MRIPFHQLQAEFKRVLLALNFSDDKAEACARIFAENSRDGVYTHGLNRFPSFVELIKEDIVKPDATPTLIDEMGAIERWDGNLGPGVLNAKFAMDRAITLAKDNGIGCVAMRNTNHWMRGGTYGLQAAEAGLIGICFTNTIAIIPPWGGIDPRLGNNPLIIAVPRREGHVLLDMALSQYSNGKLQQYKAAGEQLPIAGGYNKDGELTTDPGAILESQRPLPVGFWKGAGLALMLDLLATILSKGGSTKKITENIKEYSVSQVFICIRPDDDAQTDRLMQEIIAYAKTSRLEEEGKPVRFPGEATLQTRERNLKQGIPVDEEIWQRVLAMEGN